MKKGAKPGGDSEQVMEDLEEITSAQIDGYRASGIEGLVEHIFPDDVLPCPLEEIYEHISKPRGKYFPKKQKWHMCPELRVPSNNGDQEERFAKFLRLLADNIATFVSTTYGHTIPRRDVSAEFATQGVPGGPENTGHRPDLVFFEKGAERTWENAVGCWEVKSNNNHKLRRHARCQLTTRAFMIYESQDDRRFVPGVSILGYDVIFHIIDRAGEVASATFNMRSDPRQFLRLVVGFMFCGRDNLGFDPMFTRLPDGTSCVTIKGKVYTLHQNVHRGHTLRGRGTACWRATCEGVTYAIKDYWTDRTRASVEADLLEKAKGVQGVPKLVEHDVITFQGKEDTTGLVRKILDNPRYREQWEMFDIRVHRRLVMTPFALPIYYFRTKKEPIKGFMDCIQAHKDLLEKAKILHRDISIKNIMLEEYTEGGRTFRRGLLIDLDYATEYPEPKHRQPAKAARTGTTPFMAIDLLEDATLPHKPEWDLESFLYVLIWICVFYIGPCDRAKRIDIKETELKTWVEGDFTSIWKAKMSCMRLDPIWKLLVKDFNPYFNEIKPCIDEWRGLCNNPGLAPTHDRVLAVLQNAYDKLPDDEEPFIDPEPVAANPPAGTSTGSLGALRATPKRTRDTETRDFFGVNRREDVVHGGKRARKDKSGNAYYSEQPSEQLFQSGGESSYPASLGSFAPTDAEEGSASSSSASASVEPVQPLRRTRRKSMPSLKVRDSKESGGS